MFDLELEWTVRVRGAEEGVNFYYPSPHPSPSFRPSFTPLDSNFFLFPAFRFCKIQNGRYYFHQENSEPSLATITPALQATMLSNTMFKAIVSVFQLVSCDQNQSNNDRQSEKSGLSWGTVKNSWRKAGLIAGAWNLLSKGPFSSLNPLTPKSDQLLISPHNITPESNIKVMRIQEVITNS